MASGVKIFGSLFIWLIVLGVAVLIFFVAFYILVQCRRVNLRKIEDHVKDSELKITSKDLDDMYETVSQLWIERNTIVPIPELTHLAPGFMKDEDRNIISIKEEVLSSFKKIEDAAIMINPTFARQPFMTIRTYFDFLESQSGITIDMKNANKYIQMFNIARYGPSSNSFTPSDYAIFCKVFNKIYDSIIKSHDDPIEITE